MRRSIATVSLSGPLDAKLRAAAAAGFDAVEIFEPDLVACPLAPERLRALASDLGLAIELYQPLRDFEAVGEAAFPANLRRAGRKFDLMERLGVRTLLACSNVTPAALDDDRLAARQLRALAAAAAERGFRVAYEALAWGTRVNDYRHAWRIVQAADHQALGICLDSFHILSVGTDLSEIASIPGDRIFAVQLSDAPRLPMGLLQWSRHHRCFPGQGDLDLAAVLRQALAAGYRGSLSLEVFNDVLRQVPAGRAATDAMRSLIALEDSLGLVSLPSPSRLEGLAFIELAVDSESAAPVARTLEALGLAPAARHRSKPVTLFELAEARVLVNEADPRLGPALGRDAVLSALAVESSDPGRSAERAIALRAPERSRLVGPDEVDLTEVEAPDGTSVFFCRSDGGRQSWLRDFDRSAAAGPRPGLLGIDHVGLVQPFGHFDEAALFWRSLLGLEFLEDPELAAPVGLLRARTLADPRRRVRIALDGPLLGGGELSPSDLQHAAFATSDVLAAADAYRAAGGRALSIPANYYDDLEARFDLDPQLLASIRERSILYDRDASGGELLHFYSAALGHRLFFEVLERRGGYSGLGAANAPVRMAAQAAASALAD